MERARRYLKDKNTSRGVQSEGEGSDSGKQGTLDSRAAKSGTRGNNSEVGGHAERTTPPGMKSANMKVSSRFKKEAATHQGEAATGPFELGQRGKWSSSFEFIGLEA